jgi:hypothetical protein
VEERDEEEITKENGEVGVAREAPELARKGTTGGLEVGRGERGRGMGRE